jgi:hypothetical protein
MRPRPSGHSGPSARFAGQVRQGRHPDRARPGPLDAIAVAASHANSVGVRCGSVSDGGEGQNRTDDTQIFSLVLYQLSYLATDVGQLKKDEYTMRVRR